MTSWVLIDETNGATTTMGEKLTPEILAKIAEACSIQMVRDYAGEYGTCNTTVRAGASPQDIQPGEIPFFILADLPDSPTAIAYHDVNGNGLPFAVDAITRSGTLTGAGNSLSVAISHEILETEGDPDCNAWVDDGKGQEHARELCDPVEVQTYPVTTSDGTAIQLSDFVLPAWWDTLASSPFSFMAKYSHNGAIDPPGPLMTAPGGGGNYQIVRFSGSGDHQVFSDTNTNPRPPHINGRPAGQRYTKLHYSGSRAARRLSQHKGEKS